MTEETAPANLPTTYNLLFVCSGNTCRSPMAAGIARSEIARRGWQHVSVQSAGAAAADGQPASPFAVSVAAAHGVDLGGHSSQPLTAELVDAADLILVMGNSHLFAVNELGGGAKVALLTDFLEGAVQGTAIEDPFGADEETYTRTWEQIAQAVQGVLARIEPIVSP